MPLRRFLQTPVRSKTVRRPPIRLFVDLLEDRSVPSSVTMVSKAHPTMYSDTASGNSYSSTYPYHSSSMSADGRYTVYLSNAENIVSNQSDANDGDDVFLYDRVTGTTVLVSRSAASATTTGDRNSYSPSISADGQYVVFLSYSTNLVTGQIDGNDNQDVFLFDRVSGTTSLVSHATGSAVSASNGYSDYASLSADGNFIAFASYSTDLISGLTDANGTSDVFLYNRIAGTTSLISRSTAGSTVTSDNDSNQPLLSANGQHVAFSSYSNDLIAGFTDGNSYYNEIFHFDVATSTMTLVTRSASSATTSANSYSYDASMSSDGQRIAYVSSSSNLVSGQVDLNGYLDAFLFDLATGLNTLVSHNSSSAVTTGNNSTYQALISTNGSSIVLQSSAPDLQAGITDANGSDTDIYVYDISTDTNSLVSRNATSPTTTGENAAYEARISADGQTLTYRSYSTDVITGADGNNGDDVFVYHRGTGTTTLVSHSSATATTTADSSSYYALISSDGQYVAFVSDATNLESGIVDYDDYQDVYLYHCVSGENTLLSRRDAALPNLAGNAESNLDGNNSRNQVSADGRYLVFSSSSNNLVAGMTNPSSRNQVFLYDRVLASTTLVSHAAGSPTLAGDEGSYNPTISADGKFIAFTSYSTNLVTGFVDANSGDEDVFLYDVDAGTTVCVSYDESSPSTSSNYYSYNPIISSDGKFVTFQSASTNLVTGVTDVNGTSSDIFLYSRLTGTNMLVSRNAIDPTETSNNYSYDSIPSSDGMFVAFSSYSTDLVAGLSDSNSELDVFLFDVSAGTMSLVSRAAADPSTTSNYYSYSPRLSANGQFVVFGSRSSDLIAGLLDADPQGDDDLYLFDRLSGSMTLINHHESNPLMTAEYGAYSAVISADGNFVAFVSYSDDLVTGLTDNNDTDDVFLWNRGTNTSVLISHDAASTLTSSDSYSNDPNISETGRFVAFRSNAANLVDGQVDLNNGSSDVFLYDRFAATNILVSRSPVSPTATGNRSSNDAVISANGTYVYFNSDAFDLTPGDFNSNEDVFYFTGDTIPPAALSFSRLTPSGALTNADSLTFRITFDEAVMNVDAADFSATGTTAGISVTPFSLTQYDLTLSGGNLASLNGVVGLNFSGTVTIQDLAGNPLPGTEPAIDETFTLDNTPAALVSLKPIVTGGSVINLNLMGLPANSKLPWQIIGFQAEFGESVSGITLTTLTGLSATSLTIVNGMVAQFSVATITNGSFTVGISGIGILDLAGNSGVTGVLSNTLITKYGDVNRSGSITNADLNAIRNIYLNGLAYNPYMDLNGDGVIDREDYNICRSLLGS